jgi:hypothetical protein
MPAKHVLQHVNNVQNIVKEIPKWNNAKNYAKPALMPVASVQTNCAKTINLCGDIQICI